jgi:CBS domain-containing protein
MPSEKLVRDLIRPLDQCYCVKEEETVKEALRLMAKARQKGKPLCLIVVGEEPPEREMIKGFVTASELVFGLTTRFLKGAEKSGPIFWEGQFEAECLDGMNKRVKEIMAPVKAYVRETEMLMEAVFLLYKYQQNFLPAMSEEREEVVGTIHIHDILTHISRLASDKEGASKVRPVPCHR